MANLNKCLIIGNLTRDPELRYTAKGTAIADISLAVNRVTKGEDGQKREECTFVDITLWSRLAEVAGQYLKKGSPVFIEVVSNWTPGTTSRLVKNAASFASSASICNCWEVARTAKLPRQTHRDLLVQLALDRAHRPPGSRSANRMIFPIDDPHHRATLHFDSFAVFC